MDYTLRQFNDYVALASRRKREDARLALLMHFFGTNGGEGFTALLKQLGDDA
jgi:hypothetical protein